MGSLWLKIKVWTKVIVFFGLLSYAALFIVMNSARQVKPWFWFGHDPDTSVLILVLCAFLTGVVGTILLRTTFKTLRQVREMRERGRRLAVHDGSAGLDRNDPVGDPDRRGMGGDESRERDRFRAGGLADPGGAVAAGFRLARDGGELTDGHGESGQRDVSRHQMGSLTM